MSCVIKYKTSWINPVINSFIYFRIRLAIYCCALLKCVKVNFISIIFWHTIIQYWSKSFGIRHMCISIFVISRKTDHILPVTVVCRINVSFYFGKDYSGLNGVRYRKTANTNIFSTISFPFSIIKKAIEIIGLKWRNYDIGIFWLISRNEIRIIWGKCFILIGSIPEKKQIFKGMTGPFLFQILQPEEISYCTNVRYAAWKLIINLLWSNNLSDKPLNLKMDVSQLFSIGFEYRMSYDNHVSGRRGM